MSLDSISGHHSDSLTFCLADSTNVVFEQEETIEIRPADEAFVAGVLELPVTPPVTYATKEDSSLLGTILSAFSLFIILILFKRIVNIIPSLFACLLRWKESINLEASVKLSDDRNIIAAAMIIPFVMVSEHYSLYSPEYMAKLSETWRIAATTGTFLIYFTLRVLAELICKPSRKSNHSFQAGYKAAWSFFILLTLSLLLTGGIDSLADFDYLKVKITMYWISTVIYLPLLIREFQIFASSCSFVTAFLYLCALEIVPVGLLIGSIYVF